MVPTSFELSNAKTYNDWQNSQQPGFYLVPAGTGPSAGIKEEIAKKNKRKVCFMRTNYFM